MLLVHLQTTNHHSSLTNCLPSFLHLCMPNNQTEHPPSIPSQLIMLTDSELLEHLHNVLRTSDLDTATGATVRRRLEQELSIDLSDKKPFIRQQIDLFLQSHYTQEASVQEQSIENENENENVVKEQESDNDNDNDDITDGANVSEEDEDNGDSDDAVDDNKIKNKRTKTTATPKKRGGGGFKKPCALSPQLQKLVGEPELARTEVVKKIWAYIKEKDLQNPENKRKILCDDMLHDVFRVKSIDMFQMNKALSKHIWPLDEEEATVKTLSKSKKNKRVEDFDSEDEEEDEDTVKPSNKNKQKKGVKDSENAPTVKSSNKKKPKKRVKEDEPEQKENGKKAKASGFVSPLPISDELQQFFGTGESELSRSAVVKKMWEYIKQNDLQDPSDRRRILCDDKLKELFKVDSFVGFTVSKLLTTHFIKEKA